MHFYRLSIVRKWDCPGISLNYSAPNWENWLFCEVSNDYELLNFRELAKVFRVLCSVSLREFLESFWE